MTSTTIDMVDEFTYSRTEQQLKQLALTRAHNLLILRIGQNVNTLWNNPIQVCIAYSNIPPCYAHHPLPIAMVVSGCVINCVITYFNTPCFSKVCIITYTSLSVSNNEARRCICQYPPYFYGVPIAPSGPITC